MGFLIAFAIGSVISWIVLLIVVPIAQKLADFALPPWPETLWKLAVVVLAANAVAEALVMVHFYLGKIGGCAVFWIFMVKWFEVDGFGAFVIIGVTMTVRAWLVMLLVVPFGSLM
jgi:hypothetical protein